MSLLVVTVDTEADDLWSLPATYTCRNVARLPAFQAVCERHGVRPTYLVSHEVMADVEARAQMVELAGRQRCEIGTHLHGFSTPPEKPLTADDRRAIPFAYEYPASVVREKLDYLTQLIEATFGRRPRTIRWGQWGLNGSLVPIMEELGYFVDTTVTPGIDWRDFSEERAATAPSFVGAPLAPYSLDRDDVRRAGQSSILEVPATVVYQARWHRPVHEALSRIRLGRVSRRVRLAPRWLRPFPWVSGEALFDVAQAAVRAGAPLLNMMLHSSELLPGGSPYASTQADVDRTLANLDAFFGRLAARGLRSVGLEETFGLFGRPSTARPSVAVPAVSASA